MQGGNAVPVREDGAATAEPESEAEP